MKDTDNNTNVNNTSDDNNANKNGMIIFKLKRENKMKKKHF